MVIASFAVAAARDALLVAVFATPCELMTPFGLDDLSVLLGTALVATHLAA